jgi:hypothetical protein
MHGDFSLNPLAYRDRVSRVLSQQGRVQLDSDANEQTESFLRYLRGLGLDTIGAHGGIGNSFEVVFHAAPKEVLIRWGVYYVDGIRCVNLPRDFDVLAPEKEKKEGTSYALQRDYFLADDDDLAELAGEHLVYLDVFERHVSSAEDESLREVALMGPDTTSRAIVVWQVRAIKLNTFNDAKAALQPAPAWWAGMGAKTWDEDYRALKMMLESGVRMRARAVITEALEPCTVSPDAKYRGTENRLFRVEIHDAGDKKSATFKWSPDNASIAYPVRDNIEGRVVQLESLGRDERTAIRVNDWVEVVDDTVALMGVANPLLQVTKVNRQEMTIELSDAPASGLGSDVKKRPTILRRWASEPMPVRETPIANVRDGWLDLDNGVEIQFSRLPVPKGGYRTGDYWLIPTRTATGDVVWPETNDAPTPLPPHGVDHHYAPLAVLNIDVPAPVTDLRREFDPIAKVVP